MTTAGVYVRISLDRREGAGVARQLEDCTRLAIERGWETEVYEDNDVSAYSGKRRPEFERLLADLTARRIGAVVAYHPDRLYRQLTDLERFVEAVRAADAEVATVKAGDVDLATASGRMIAAILGSVARHESERTGERIARAKRQLAAEGRPAGGGVRPFGLTQDRTALVPVEADAIRRAADAVLVGGSLGAEVRRLNEAGILSPRGRSWTVGNLRRTLCSPHVAAVRTYHGQIVGDATSPAILDRATWDTVRALAAARTTGRPRSPRHLLTGLLACSRCGWKMHVVTVRNGRGNYACPPWPTTRGRGCNRISVTAAPLEAHVVDVVTGWLARPSFVTELADHLTYGGDVDGATHRELDEVKRRTTLLTSRFAADELTEDEWDAARSTLSARRVELEARLTGATRARTNVSAAELAATWADPDLSAEVRRGILEAVLAHPVPVLPGRDDTGRRRALAERVDLCPAWDPAGP